ncbi:MAG: BON domain-containing protein, partial [Steroidobacter sp.]
MAGRKTTLGQGATTQTTKAGAASAVHRDETEGSDMWESNRTGGSAGYLGVGVAAAMAAAGAAFFLDPRSGGRRRALLRDQVNRGASQSREFVGKVGRDARHRTRGLYSDATAVWRRVRTDDQILEARVRSELGRLTTHPRSITVHCKDGVITLQGDVLEDEANALERGVARVRGVKDVANEMRVHAEAGNLPALQGEPPRRAPRFEYLQSNWSPAPRVLAGAAGFALVLGGVARRDAVGYGLAAGGAALLVRSICNMPLLHLVGIRASDADGVLVQKTMEVHAEVDEVYECWRALESLPVFMSHIREVSRIDDTRYHWVVDGPAGMP